jgi:hypothetical protein
MRNYQLTPKTCWSSFTENPEVGDYIYSTLMPLVNEGSWNYMNYTSDTGIFEDEIGNSIFLEFDESGEEIRGLRISIKQIEGNKLSMLEKTIISLESKYNLMKSSTDSKAKH